ncbi:MAG: M48 family metallopeptidase [Betaproteobacteria bacterium]|nr:M48 family metallopeptidase [Betaproteobacteria bacterium]NCS61848.1 M48 family metallopeptidase [Rhodoferax sp.]
MCSAQPSCPTRVCKFSRWVHRHRPLTWKPRPTGYWIWSSTRVATEVAAVKATETSHLLVGGIKVEVVRKDIKNLHLGVYPPMGRVRVAVPLVISDEAVRLAVIDKLGWIKRQRAKFAEQPRQSQREMVNGESHYFLGKRYRLRMHAVDAPPRVVVRGITSLDLYVRPGATVEQRELVLLAWYRDQLKALIPPLLDEWQPILGVQASQWGVKKMKTKWGSCNTAAKRIWLNLELAKKPEMCLEYIVVHELVHLLERKHSERFTALMDSYLPNWRVCRETLNGGMLGHEVWTY